MAVKTITLMPSDSETAPQKNCALWRSISPMRPASWTAASQSRPRYRACGHRVTDHIDSAAWHRNCHRCQNPQSRVGDITRFRSAAAFATYTGDAPIEVFSGDVVRHRRSRAGDRQLNSCLHVMALVQTRDQTEGRAYFPRKREYAQSKVACTGVGSGMVTGSY